MAAAREDLLRALPRLRRLAANEPDGVLLALDAIDELLRRVPVVIVTRDPDYANEYAVFGGEADTYDIDLGRSDLSDPDEFAEWRESHLAGAAELRARGHEEAARHIEATVAETADNHGHDAAAPTFGQLAERAVDVLTGHELSPSTRDLATVEGLGGGDLGGLHEWERAELLDVLLAEHEAKAVAEDNRDAIAALVALRVDVQAVVPVA